MSTGLWVSHGKKKWSDWEIAIIREELVLGSQLSRAQVVRNCRKRLKDRSESAIADKFDELRKAA